MIGAIFFDSKVPLVIRKTLAKVDSIVASISKMYVQHAKSRIG